MSYLAIGGFAAAIIALILACSDDIGSDESYSALGTLAYEAGGFIRIVNVSGKDIETLVTNQISGTPVEGSHPAWAPDGNSLAYVSVRNGSSKIYLMNSDGSDQALLVNNQPGARDLDWSPGGTKIVFSSTKGGNLQLYLLDLENRDVVQLTGPPGTSYGASWSPGGTNSHIHGWLVQFLM